MKQVALRPPKGLKRAPLVPRDAMTMRLAFDIFRIVAGALLIAAGVAMFLAPNDIAPGGLTGLTLLLRHVSGVPMGVTLVVVNVGLLAIATRLHKQPAFVWKSALGVAALAAGLELFSGRVGALTSEPLLLTLYGGLLDGAGIALVYFGGGSTGGVDIVARIVQRRLSIPPGRTILILNTAVYVLAAGLFGIERAMLALLLAFVSARTLDAVIQGVSATRTVLVVTSRPIDVTRVAVDDLQLGVTILPGKGGFDGGDRPVLLLVVPRSDVLRLRRRVLDLDERALITVMRAESVAGGFAIPRPEL